MRKENLSNNKSIEKYDHKSAEESRELISKPKKELFRIKEEEESKIKERKDQEFKVESLENDLKNLEELRRLYSLDDKIIKNTKSFLLNEKDYGDVNKKKIQKKVEEESKRSNSNKDKEETHPIVLSEKPEQEKNEEKDLKVYFANKFLKALREEKEDTIKRNQESRIWSEKDGIPDEAKYMIGKNALKKLAEDPKMPEDKSQTLTIMLRMIDLHRGITREVKNDNIIQMFSKGELAHLIDELRSILPEEAINVLESSRKRGQLDDKLK